MLTRARTDLWRCRRCEKKNITKAVRRPIPAPPLIPNGAAGCVESRPVKRQRLDSVGHPDAPLQTRKSQDKAQGSAAPAVQTIPCGKCRKLHVSNDPDCHRCCFPLMNLLQKKCHHKIPIPLHTTAIVHSFVESHLDLDPAGPSLQKKACEKCSRLHVSQEANSLSKFVDVR